ncbi:EcsC family protein [Methylocystis parvus]|uniref:EcsC family protein n=1 Tax=Methylocystis parvus TaxID=134 RepID=A0A6B8MBJ7_9HYPH|nr:EcsC family protein [Methylocystis parvus]QGM99132.1 EcsC family protein [Methylocystis parvus]WBK00497.1 EcsC family protein [Methylocystis parvus OBBP]
MSSYLPVLYETQLSSSDWEALRAAVAALERQSFAARIARLAGRKVGLVSKPLPPQVKDMATAAAQKALETALNVALTSLEGAPKGDSTRKHKRLAALAGGIGGAVGLASLPFELPLSTTIMLRSIADIARNEGENLREPETGLACLEVFALGGHMEDNVLEGGYLAMRGLLAKSVSDAARFVAARGLTQQNAPVIIRLLSQFSTRFGVVVSQKIAAQAVPIIGGISGAAINLAFTEHFQTLARGHFTIRRLERVYDPGMVRAHYARIARDEGYWDPPGGA